MALNIEQPLEALTFRRMQAADLDYVMANELASYDFAWTRGVFEDCLRARHECWVLLQEAAIIGHGVLSLAAREAHLLNVCVRRQDQGRGHGKALVRHLLARAHASADMVFLEARPSNTVALRLYASLGFNEIGLRRNYYPATRGREDALVLALQF